MTAPEQVRLSAAEGEAIIVRLSVYAPSRSDCEICIQVIRLYFWFTAVVEEAKLSLKKLRTLLLGRGPRRPKPSDPASSSLSDSAGGEGEATGEASTREEAAEPSEAAGSTSGSGESASAGKPKGGHRPGTGRLGADAYVGAERVECRHEELAVGQRCPVCGQGTLYELPPGRQIRIDGHALLSALRYELQKLRCSACGQLFTAPLPEEAGEETYSPRARAVLAVSRCYLGVPLYRLQGYQAMLGVPVPDATQWDQIEKIGDCSYPVFAYLERLAAQGELIHQDDTSVRILSLMAENLRIQAQAEALGLSRPTERTGMFTTGLVVQVGAHTICLYYSGRDHAGEHLQSLLLQRQAGLAKPLVMSDALSRNEANESELIRCHCLAHGRRQFSDLEDTFPVECQMVIEALKQVFDHDDEARDQQLSPEARLAYHQALSQPIMDGLKQWLQKQFDDRLVEPNSSLGKAISYLQTHWSTLTRFLSIPGAPLDNNVVERALKLFIRQRKNSLFFRTEHSAYIASVITSLIATCFYAGVNALDYLVALQEHRREVFADPAAWLPWSYAPSRASP
jgi:transposase